MRSNCLATGCRSGDGMADGTGAPSRSTEDLEEECFIISSTETSTTVTSELQSLIEISHKKNCLINTLKKKNPRHWFKGQYLIRMIDLFTGISIHFN